MFLGGLFSTAAVFIVLYPVSDMVMDHFMIVGLQCTVIAGSRVNCSCCSVRVAATGMQQFLNAIVLYQHQQCQHILYQDHILPLSTTYA